MTTVESLHHAFAQGLDAAARVRARRPGSLFQVELPAFASDGDVAAIYVRPGSDGRLLVTDLGSTRTKVSYARTMTCEVDEELARLAEHQGLTFEEGEIRTEVSARDLLAAALGLLQVEAQAERLAVVSKRRSHEATQFRDDVLALLHDIFGDKMQKPFFDKKTDPEALFQVDALITAAKPLAVAVIPGDLEAERAVGAKLALAGAAPPKTRWIAIPRDMERLTSRTRKRLNREYLAAGSTFEEDREIVEERLRDLAEVA
ncbi:MAG: DUF1828 domain-containing protein [Polyangiaceae bacterium]